MDKLKETIDGGNAGGSRILALQLKGWFKSKTSIQECRNEIQNSY